MKSERLLFLLFLVISLDIVAKNTLIYKQPANNWIEALPLGNGRIGAMIYGGVPEERISLSEVTLWAGKEDPNVNNLCGKDKLALMRETFFSGNIAEGNRIGREVLSGHSQTFGTNLPFGDIIIEFPQQGETANYTRCLSLDDAIARVSYSCEGIDYTNEYFCSNPSQVMVAHFSASEKGKVSARIKVEMLRYSTITTRDNQIEITGDARRSDNNVLGVKFFGQIKVIANGGEVKTDGETLVVNRVNYFTLIVDLCTNFHNEDYSSQCKKSVDEASVMDYTLLKNIHTKDFGQLFNRMDVNLGSTRYDEDNVFDFTSTVGEGNGDPAFDALFLQYGRYMLISSSRENSPLPAHLQGIWNDNLACNMAWTCDYHLDINIQQNYWSANIANLPECNTPLFSYLVLLAKYGAETAKTMYGCDGWVAHTINNVWGHTAPGGDVGWAMNVTAGAWLATHLWTHYDYTRDTDFLSNIGYPLLKETAKFFVDYMVKDPHNGYLVTGPSISPEISFRADNGECYSLSMMPTIDRAVVHDIYKSCIESCKVLGIDDAFCTRIEKDIMLLPPYRIGTEGDLREWLLPVVRSDISHRHSSHLLGLYPFGEISPDKTPTLAAACKRFLELQTQNAAWEDTEWSRGCMINYYARLKDAEEAYASLQCLYSGFMRKNLMTVSPAGVAGAENDIFSFDATEAAVSGMCEMILQSYAGYLDFLPALPSQWKNGHIRGICARGGIEADIMWVDGKVTSATLRSKINQVIECRLNGERKNVILKAREETKII